MTEGWEAINGALDRLYPEVEPVHLGTIIRWRLGGPDPLDGVSIYPRGDHWHYISFGMSELYEKESDDPQHSGWGFEFTFRVARAAGEEEPPRWATNLLQNMGRYVFQSGNSFAAGHYIDLNGPIRTDRPDTEIRYVAFIEDPELGSIGTPNGSVMFLQLVGLTRDEYEAAQAWNAESLLRALGEHIPLLVTDTDRGSLIPLVGQAVEVGIRRDGSSSSGTYVPQLHWEPGRITLGAHGAPQIAKVLRGRLPFGWPYTVTSADVQLTFVPGEHLSYDDSSGELSLPPGLLEPLARALVPVAGETTVADGLTVRIVPTEIKDEEGNVLYVIGAPV